MAVTVTEKWESRDRGEGESPGVEVIYLIDGTDSDGTAIDALLDESAAIYDGLYRQTTRIQRMGEEAWLGRVTYGQRESYEAGDSVYEFDTTGGTAHITQGLDTARYAKPGETAPDFKGAIGVTENAVEGVDVLVPKFAFSERHYLAAELVTPAYKAVIANLTGRVNLDPFRGFAQGEVLFLGAQGSVRSSTDWEISYRFEASPNVSGLTIGEIGGVAKRGHDYLWVRYEEEEDAAAHSIVRVPKAVYVEQVYQYGLFAGLGI